VEGKNTLCSVLIFLLTAAFPAMAGDLRSDMETANKEWLTAYNTQQEASVFAAMYTKDATVLPPSAQPVVGAEAIGQFWADRIRGGTRKNHTFEIVSIRQDGRYAYQVARWTVDVTNEKGETTKMAGNTVRIFEKQPSGKWLTKVHIFNAY
jgi:ketosteroid isomerase-like protein